MIAISTGDIVHIGPSKQSVLFDQRRLSTVATAILGRSPPAHRDTVRAVNDGVSGFGVPSPDETTPELSGPHRI
jgi:hypothetical protein